MAISAAQRTEIREGLVKLLRSLALDTDVAGGDVENILESLMNTRTALTATSVSDGTATLTGGDLTGAGDITATGTVTGASVTDGTRTIGAVARQSGEVAFTNIEAAGLTGTEDTYTLYTFPAGAFLIGVSVKLTVDFTGSWSTFVYDLYIDDGTANLDLVTNADPTSGKPYDSGVSGTCRDVGGHSLILRATSTGADLSTTGAGNLSFNAIFAVPD